MPPMVLKAFSFLSLLRRFYYLDVPDRYLSGRSRFYINSLAFLHRKSSKYNAHGTYANIQINTNKNVSFSSYVHHAQDN